jgi:predicted O-methyltransferase YrrM
VALDSPHNPNSGFKSIREQEAARNGADAAELARLHGVDVGSLQRYNDAVRKSPRLEPLLLPLWDGLSLARIVD